MAAIKNKVCANCDTPAISQLKRVCRKCHGNIWREMTAEEIAHRDAQAWRIQQTFNSLVESPPEPVRPWGQYTTTITVERKTLSDGSHVFDVRLSEPSFAAITEEDAFELAENLARAIEARTNELVRIVEEEVAA